MQPMHASATGVLAGCLGILGLFAAIFIPGGVSLAESPPLPDILSVEQLSPGMTGLGYTVFQGDRVEEFGVEILGVMKGARAGGDLIIFRGQGPVLERTGIIAGMSGSPVYVDGKLIGAVAFAYPMGKEPIGAITPIAEMLPLLEIPREPAAGGGHAGGLDDLGRRADLDPGQALGGDASVFDALWQRFVRRESWPVAVPEPPSKTVEAAGMVLRTISLPLSAAGWDGNLQGEMVRSLVPLGFVPAGAGIDESPAGDGTGRFRSRASVMKTGADGVGEGLRSSVMETAAGASSEGGPTLKPGSAVAVQLVRGDASLAAVGTVTWVSQDRVLAFGHPMMQSGSVALPMTAAWIHTVIPSLDVSFKMGSPTVPVGGIWQDRRPGVAGSMDAMPDMLPLSVSVEALDRGTSVYHYNLVRHPALTPMLVPWTVANSYLAEGWSQGDAIATGETEVFLRDGRRVYRRDRYQTETPALDFGAQIALPVNLLWTNPFTRVGLDSVAVRVRYAPGNQQATIRSVEVDGPTVRQGSTLEVRVVLEPHRSAPTTHLVRFPVPTAWAGKTILVAAGGVPEMMEWDHDRAPGKYDVADLNGLLHLIETIPPDGALVVRVVAREPGAVLQSTDLASLPASIARAAAARGGAEGVQKTASALLAETVEETPWVVTGRQGVELTVEP